MISREAISESTELAAGVEASAPRSPESKLIRRSIPTVVILSVKAVYLNTPVVMPRWLLG
jgi:hypothetical protein